MNACQLLPADPGGMVRSVLVGWLLCGMISAPASAQERTPATRAAQEAGGLPAAEEILDGYVEATGGKRAYQRLRSRVSKGTFEMPALGLTGTIETYAAAPDKLYSVTHIGELAKVEKGYDGKTAWEYSELAGARVLSGAELAFTVREATFNADLNWRKVCKSQQTVGLEIVGGEPAYKVEVVTVDDAKMTLYYDKYTNYLVRLDAKMTTQLGEVAVEVYPSDYRKVSGVLVARKTTQKVLGVTQVMTFDEIKFNARIPKDRFKLPGAVRELAD